MNVCESLLETLTGYGVDVIFGIPGDAINELIEALRKQTAIRFIHVMHEEAGAFAASAQAKLTGRLAVCVGTAGPGAIHLLNGLYDAKMDHAPVLAITGQVETSLIGTSYHQEVDLDALFEDVAVYNQTVITAAQMPHLGMLACQAAVSKRGVAHLSIPSNISVQKVGDSGSRKVVFPGFGSVIPCAADLQSAAAIINAAERPCILAGIGAADARSELLAFAEHIQAPVIKSLRGKDLLPDVHPMTLGGLGLLGTRPALDAVKTCDVLIAIGTDYPYHAFYPPDGVPTIQIDQVADQIGKRHPVSNPLVGDAALTLKELLPLLSGVGSRKFLVDSGKDMKSWLSDQDEKECSPDMPIHPQTLVLSA